MAELEIRRSPYTTAHKRYDLPPGTPTRWTVDLPDALLWGLYTLHDRSWRTMADMIAGAVKRELSAYGIDTGMTPPPQTWRSRLAFWLIRREKELNDRRRK